MSRSNPTQVGPKNPSTRFFEWKGGKGILGYWDKDKGEKGEFVEVKLPFTFLYLDHLSTVKGFSKKHDCGVFANAVRSTNVEPLNVRFHNKDQTVVAKGLWSEIKDVVTSKNNGGKFCSDVFIAYKDESGKLAIGMFSMVGSSLSPWFDFSKKNRDAMHTKAVVVTKGELNDEGVEFYPPVFGVKDVSAEMDAQAKELDKVVTAYIDAYLSRGTAPSKPATASAAKAEQPTAAKPASKPAPDPEPTPAQESDGQPPEDDSDVPFN